MTTEITFFALVVPLAPMSASHDVNSLINGSTVHSLGQDNQNDIFDLFGNVTALA